MIGSWHRRIVVVAIMVSLPGMSSVATGHDEPCIGTFIGATLVDSLLDISQTMTSLKLLNGRENPELKRFLEWRLASAIQHARHAVENHPVIDPVSLPNIVVNFRRDIRKAKIYIVEHQLNSVSLLAKGDAKPLKPLEDLRPVEEWFSRHPPPGLEK